MIKYIKISVNEICYEKFSGLINVFEIKTNNKRKRKWVRFNDKSEESDQDEINEVINNKRVHSEEREVINHDEQDEINEVINNNDKIVHSEEREEFENLAMKKK
jgi:hypothetical protein